MNSRRTAIDMQFIDDHTGWQPLAGFPGLEAKTLSNDLDETGKIGGRTRLVRFAVGAATTQTLVHDYWEEVYLLSGDLWPLEQADRTTVAPAYSCRPPETPHGPFLSGSGCLLLEMQYYLR